MDVLDRRRHPGLVLPRELEGGAVDVDVAAPLRQPVGELQGGITQGPTQRLLGLLPRRRLRHLDEEPPDPGARQPRLDDAEQEEEWDGRERGEGDPVDGTRVALADRPDDDVRDQERAGDEAREQHRCENAPHGGRCRVPAPGEQHDERPEDEHRPGVDDQVESRREHVAVRHERGVGRAVAVRLRLRVEQERDEGTEPGEDVAGTDGHALRPPGQGSGGVREQEVHEDRGPERADGEPDRVRNRSVRLAQGSREPGETEADHEPADGVLGRACPRDEPGADE